MAKKIITQQEALDTLKKMKIDIEKQKFNTKDFTDGMNVELEHGKVDPQTNVTDDDPVLTAKIALRHLKENFEYYRKLNKMEDTFKPSGETKVAMEKVALNAQKARAMAKEVGLIPEGQWKWALRKLRGKSGRELAEAKEELGSLSNNKYQKILAAQRKQGLGIEVGGNVNSEKIIKGTKGGVSYDISLADFHTHPNHNRNYYLNIARNADSATKEEFLKRFESKKEPLRADMSSYISHAHNTVFDKHKFNKARNTVMSDEYDSYSDVIQKVNSPEVYGHPTKEELELVKKVGPVSKYYFSQFPSSGDYGGRISKLYSKEQSNIMWGRKENFVPQPTKDNIVAPDINVEGVHRVRAPGRKTSIYFDRRPRAERNAFSIDNLMEKEAMATAWKRELGKLSQESRKKLIDSGILDYSKELSGLKKGSDNLIKKYNITENKVNGNSLFKSKANGLDNTIYTSSGTSHDDEILRRHEIDEIRSFIKDYDPRIDKSIDSAIDKNPNLSWKKAIKKSKKSMPDFSTHYSPKVVMRESANIAVAPDDTRTLLKTIRTISGEKKSLKNYGFNYGESGLYNPGNAKKLEKKYINSKKNNTAKQPKFRLRNIVEAFKDASTYDNLMEKVAALKDNVELYLHQQRVVDDPTTSKIIAHDVGSGKTLTGIAKFERMKENNQAHKALVVVPAGLRENFALQGVGKFTNSSYNIVGTKQEIKDGIANEINDTSDYNIISYDIFKKNPEKYIQESGADTVITDESHRQKNEETAVTESLKKTRKLYKNYIGLTGSVVSNTLSDVQPLVEVASGGGHNLGESKQEFEKKYLKRSQSSVYKGLHEKRIPVVGFNNKEQLKKELAKYVDYMGPDDVKDIADMPNKQIQLHRIPVSKEQAKLYKQILKKSPAAKKMILTKRLETLKDEEAAKAFSSLVEARKLMNSVGSVKPGIKLDESAKITPKTRALINDLDNYLKHDPEGQALLFSHLINGGVDVMEAGLKDKGIEYGKFIGKGNEGVSEKTRQKDVNDYNARKKRVLLISSAGGEGLSLNDTSWEGVLDPHYNPEKMKQMEARGIRSGGLKGREDRTVNVNRYIATMPRTFGIFKSRYKTPDEFIYEIAQNKDKQNQLLYKLLQENAKSAQKKYNAVKKKELKYNASVEASASLN